MKTQSFPDPEPRCTCMRVWMAVIPPPPCPVHDKFTMWNAVRYGEITANKIVNYTITTNTANIGNLSIQSVKTGTLNITGLDGQ